MTDRTLKYTLIEMYTVRNDEWSSEVQLRAQESIPDGDNVDGLYHVDCRCKFTTKWYKNSDLRNIVGSRELQQIIDAVYSDPTRMWTSVELYKLYINNYENSLLTR